MPPLCKNSLKERFVKLNPLNANPTKCSNTLKKFDGNLPTNCLSVYYQERLIKNPTTQNWYCMLKQHKNKISGRNQNVIYDWKMKNPLIISLTGASLIPEEPVSCLMKKISPVFSKNILILYNLCIEKLATSGICCRSRHP